MNGESQKKKNIAIEALIYGTFSINEVTQLLPMEVTKSLILRLFTDLCLVGNSLGIKHGSLYITSEALRGCLKSRLVVRKLTV